MPLGDPVLRDILAMIAVQAPSGMVFGTARKLDGNTLHFELDGDVPAGTVVEFRMELPGLDETAMGKLRVVGVRQEPGKAVKTWSAAVVAVSEADEEIFQVWRRTVDEGSRAFALSTKLGADDWFRSQTMAGSSPAERARAVAVQEERRKRRVERARALVKNAKRWPDPEDRDGGQSVASGVFRASLSGAGRVPSTGHVVSNSEGTHGEGDRPRRAVAVALRSHLKAGRGKTSVSVDEDSQGGDSGVFGGAAGAAPAVPELPPVDLPVAAAAAPGPAHAPPSAPRTSLFNQPRPTIPPAPAPASPRATGASLGPVPVPGGVARPSAPPASVPSLTRSRGTLPPAAVGVPAPDDPTVVADRGMVSLVFRDPGLYRQHFLTDLAGGHLQVAKGGLGDPGTRLGLYFRLPSGQFLQLSGEVVLSSADATGISLHVDASARKLLELG